jgi:hypothetical protein
LRWPSQLFVRNAAEAGCKAEIQEYVPLAVPLLRNKPAPNLLY